MEFTGNNTTVAEVNDYVRMYKKPAFIFLGFLTIIGLFGNLLVIYVFGYRMKKQKVQHFIMLLAVYDILCCLFGLPLKMLELWMPITYPAGPLCKIENAVICFVCVSSAITLLVISVDRYKKVCHPTKSQMTLFHVKISFYVITLVSLAFSVTASFVYDRRSKPLVEDGEIMFYICEADLTSMLTHAYYMTLAAVLIVVLLGLLVFYLLIWKTAKKHLDNSSLTYRVDLQRCASQINQSKKPKNTNTILVLISLLFAVSFVPSLIFSAIFGNLFGKNLSFFSKVLIELVYATWGLNSSMNPIIYGFYNRNFILHVQNLFTQCGALKKYQKNVTSGDTSGTA